ncbi:hypothetical protein AVEN_100322-1 [Araneus ventricosus]|uniref:DUF4817 domain-containing protein n=1 Tax=Araneus ventricosus TaxID=182803 RepID=A0A4Y2U1Z6_ARAVE|nr:hypothetical protein AVEN_100322-1 [Araneus ventricosus]
MRTSEEKSQCGVWFIEIKSKGEVQRNFQKQCGREPPSRSTLWALYTPIIETGRVLQKQVAGHPFVSDTNVELGYQISPIWTRLQPKLSPVTFIFFDKSAAPGKNYELPSYILKIV